MVNEARGDRWDHYAMTCTEFLLAALTGDVQSDVLSSRPVHPARIPAADSRLSSPRDAVTNGARASEADLGAAAAG